MADVKVKNSKEKNRRSQKFDRNLNRIFKICSIFFSAIVAFTAIVGFFYVVLPLYQTKLLVEENAKSKLELDSSKKELTSINRSLELAQNRLDSTNKINDSLYNISNSFSDSILQLSKQTDIFKRNNSSLINEITSNKNLLNESYSKLRIEYSGKYWDEMYANIFDALRNNIHWESKNKDYYYTIDYNVSNDKYLTKYRPYYLMIDVINSMFDNDKRYISIPKDTISLWKNNTLRFINANKENLITEFDIDKIRKEYEMKSIEFVNEINKKIEDENNKFEVVDKENNEKIKNADEEQNEYDKKMAENQKQIDEIEHGMQLRQLNGDLRSKLSELNIKYMKIINEYDDKDINKIELIFKKYPEMFK